MFILKTNSNGNLDNQFGTNGKISIANISGESNVTSGNNNTIIVSGSLHNSSIEYARYFSNGKPDNSFGTNGALIENVQSATGAIVVQPDNSVVADAHVRSIPCGID